MNRLIVAVLAAMLFSVCVAPQVWAQDASAELPTVPWTQGYPVGGPGVGTGDKGPINSLKFDIGYLTYKSPVVREVTCDAHQTRLDFPLQGLWLGFEGTRRVSDRVAVVAKGTWLVPLRGSAFEELGFFLPPPWPKATRSWSTYPQWYSIDGAIRYALTDAVWGIAGFRFDSFATSFRNCSDISGVAALLPSDEADCASMSYIPYVGLMVSYGSALRASFVASPRVAGIAQYRETFGGDTRWDGKGAMDRGYFGEFSVEYGGNLPRGRLALLIKWIALYNCAPLHVDVLTTGNPGAHSSPTAPFSLPFVLDRRNWVIGASFAIDFAGPF